MHLDLSLNVSTPFGIYFILFYDFDSIAFYDFELVSFYDFDSIAFYDFELVSFYDFDLIPCSFMLLLVRSTAHKRRKPFSSVAMYSSLLTPASLSLDLILSFNFYT